MEKWNEEESNENKLNLMITWKEEKKKVVRKVAMWMLWERCERTWYAHLMFTVQYSVDDVIRDAQDCKILM